LGFLASDWLTKLEKEILFQEGRKLKINVSSGRLGLFRWLAFASNVYRKNAFSKMSNKNASVHWRLGAVDISSASGSEDPGSKHARV
jgi:hypothetical protein